MHRYLEFFDYYLEVFAKNMSGRGLMNPEENGEYAVLERVIQQNKDAHFCFIDGGSNVGNHIKKFDFLCRKHGVTSRNVFAVEPFPATVKALRSNLQNIKFTLVEAALGKEIGTIKFFSEAGENDGGQNSAIQHYFLRDCIDVRQTTVDAVFEKFDLSIINFLKLDIEGNEYNALLGAQTTIKKGLIDYIQLEYGQTWIEGGGSIEKLLSFAEEHSYDLFRIKKKTLLSIPHYHFVLDDFFYCNLLLVRKGKELPLPSTRKAIPII